MFANIDIKKFWRTIIDTMQEGLMLIDPYGQVILVNKTFEKLLGYTAEELKGTTCDIFQCDRCYTKNAEGLTKHCALFQDKTVESDNCIFIKKDGNPIHLLKSGSLIRDKSGAIIGGIESLLDLSNIVSKENIINNLRQRLQHEEGFRGIIGSSSSIQDMLKLSLSAARSDAPIIIYGESGTGKELLATAIHENSPRREQPFIKANCAALNKDLLESELFGHVKGAFAGAEHSRKGKIEAAHGGNIFFEEIGDLPLSTQTKLLRILQEKQIERVGDLQPIEIDVRIIAATHKDLKRLIQEELFREDLYYRINVVPIHVPPLLERKSDIPLLIESFIQKLSNRTNKKITSISREALNVLMDHSWPGNIRELINVLEYAFVLCSENQISLSHLPLNLIHPDSSSSDRKNSGNLRKRQQDAQKKQLTEALKASGGNQTKAAEVLGVSRVTVWKRMKKFKIQS